MTTRISAVPVVAKSTGRCLRDRFDFAEITDRARMPWRFFARRMAVDGGASL
jgi:hypothetical protein